MTIEKYPLFNAALKDETIKIGKSVDVGLAMALEEGLIVPVIKEAHRKSLSQLCLARLALIQKAQGKKLTLDDMTGSTFTVSNLGQFNIDFFTSIINPPETAILSVARMKDQAVVVDGELAIRPIIKMGLSIDHRVVDGADGARFLQDLQTLLENPFEMCTI
jgi:pyruvate dehydrogenase E2 component (dihydrolipoamide acetyltransferase)